MAEGEREYPDPGTWHVGREDEDPSYGVIRVVDAVMQGEVNQEE
jgi:hypothetical protein